MEPPVLLRWWGTAVVAFPALLPAAKAPAPVRLFVVARGFASVTGVPLRPPCGLHRLSVSVDPLLCREDNCEPPAAERVPAARG